MKIALFLVSKIFQVMLKHRLLWWWRQLWLQCYDFTALDTGHITMIGTTYISSWLYIFLQDFSFFSYVNLCKFNWAKDHDLNILSRLHIAMIQLKYQSPKLCYLSRTFSHFPQYNHIKWAKDCHESKLKFNSLTLCEPDLTTLYMYICWGSVPCIWSLCGIKHWYSSNLLFPSTCSK